MNRDTNPFRRHKLVSSKEQIEGIQLRQNDSAKWEHDIGILGFVTGGHMLNGEEREHSISGCLLKTS